MTQRKFYRTTVQISLLTVGEPFPEEQFAETVGLLCESASDITVGEHNAVASWSSKSTEISEEEVADDLIAIGHDPEVFDIEEETDA